jgi:plasmid replication initiation protein
MDAPPSLQDFGQLRRRVIEPAVNELTAKDGWTITWEPIKAGRRVKALRFEFERKNLQSVKN